MDLEMVLREFQNIISEERLINNENTIKESITIEEKFESKLKQYNTKLLQLNRLLSSLEDAKRQIEESRNISEELQIQIIRAKSHQKKLTKNIEKLKSLNASRVKLDVSENDKIKVAKSKLKLKLIKLMTKTYINTDSKGFTVNISNLEPHTFQLNRNNSEELNRDLLWNNIGQSTVHSEKWSSLFK